MENESDIIESLNAIGYRGDCLKKNILSDALVKGAASSTFRALIAWIVYELHVLRKTDEIVHDDGDKNTFILELSALLTELGCPFQKFVTGPYSCRFPTKQLKIQLLEYLITELMTTKMCLRQKPVMADSFIIPKFETNTARALESITNDLGMTRPPENISPRALFDKLNFKLEEAKRGANKLVVGDSLLNSEIPLTEEQWKKLEEIQKTLDDEYNLRRQVLLTRLEVTVQSFQWTDRIKGSEELISNQYHAKLKELDKCRFGGKDTDIVALLSARSDLAVIEKTSNAQVRKNTGTKIQKHVIGSVPDRGGRANEHAPPPPEMPSWQTQRSAGPARGGFGGGDRGGYRGGRGGRGGGGGGGNRGDGGNSRGGGGNWNNNSGGGNYQSNQNQGGGGGGGNNNWLSGSGRVQGSGWQPKQSFNDMQANISNNHYGDNRAGRGEYSGNPDGYNAYGGQQQQKQQSNSQRSVGSSNYNRGRSNYYRGGGGGGGGSGNYRHN